MAGIKIDKSDTLFSQYIRLRDKKCCRCGSPVRLNDEGLPVSHQCSHYWSRGKEGTRFEPDNSDTLCYGCHERWGHGDERDDYKQFKIEQLGEKRFKSLMIQAYQYKKKDRKMSLIVAKELLKSVKT
jgi:5-methylcytosine-specific restriction endonuclease McrA